MYRNPYQTQSNFRSQTLSSFGNATGPGFHQRAPLYPIGPTLTQPNFHPMSRPMSPSPYLGREGMRPPSYDERLIQRNSKVGEISALTYEEREKKIIQRNERQINQEQKRREQIRVSLERQINALNAKLNRNLQSKQKLLHEIENHQNSYDEMHNKLMSLEAPKNNADGTEPIERKQQQMIILKNKLINNMREMQSDLYKKEQEEQKYWEDQISQKDKILLRMEQNLRQKTLQLHREKQKSQEKPDLLSLKEEVRENCYQDFLHQYDELDGKIRNMIEEREKSAKEVRDILELKKPQFHNLNVRKAEISREHTDLKIRIEELERVSKYMEAANQNLSKELQRKDQIINKYEIDIHDLRNLREQTDSELNQILNDARQRSKQKIFNTLHQVINQAQEDLRFEQSTNLKLKNQYSKLYELMCSSSSKHIHQTFSETLVARN